MSQPVVAATAATALVAPPPSTATQPAPAAQSKPPAAKEKKEKPALDKPIDPQNPRFPMETEPRKRPALKINPPQPPTIVVVETTAEVTMFDLIEFQKEGVAPSSTTLKPGTHHFTMEKDLGVYSLTGKKLLILEADKHKFAIDYDVLKTLPGVTIKTPIPGAA